MLTWYDEPQRDLAGNTLGVSYIAQIPHWGEARIHPLKHHPGEAFLDCPALGIEMYSLGAVTEGDTMNPAETVLMKALEQRGIWCLEALTAIGLPEE